ncbi:glycosyltransferase 87 family protein [Lentzea albida]|uniref:Alpha-1,2-mannosyltransferase n=1 Tax=Lentzea albida TaxID=65499 RepID=A0A1H9SAV3_9PSEU|nr:glycosyltransferase 87 family protein [Lentzea albida]SER81503.1 alpha-1,2-mannosyltransferase [Lentzea albida]
MNARRFWAAISGGLLVWVLVRSLGSGVLDLRVYLAGGEAWLASTGLYTAYFHAPGGLPFTYPPFAAMLFSALTPLPLAAAALLFTALGIGLFTAAARTWAGFGVIALCLLLEPLRVTLDLGQVNLVLLGLVAADCLLPRTPWPRGALVGLAAAIKLTPAVFVLFFLCRKRWKPALTAVATFVACAALAPGQAKQFWLHAMLDPDRVGGVAYSANQSLRGLFSRLGAPESTWIVAAVAVLALTVVVLPRLRDDLTALVATAAAGLLISPVSWSHHWVWIAPALVLLRGRVRIAVVMVFAVGPHWLLPTAGDRELAWTWWQHVVGNTYVWLGLAFLGWCAVRVGQSRLDGAPVRNPVQPQH